MSNIMLNEVLFNGLSRSNLLSAGDLPRPDARLKCGRPPDYFAIGVVVFISSLRSPSIDILLCLLKWKVLFIYSILPSLRFPSLGLSVVVKAELTSAD